MRAGMAAACSGNIGVASPQAQAKPPAAQPCRRRAVLALPVGLAWAAAVQRPARASENAGGVDSSTSPLVQELLRRTEEKREERVKERLDDYYRRNYSDYFAFEAGSADGRSSSENQKRIREWLDKNVEPALPVEAAKRRQ